MYNDSDNVVGLKVNIRMLVDYRNEEFDLMCGVACHHDANDTKSKNDLSKLMREGKAMQRNFAHIFFDGNAVGYVWIVQVNGTKCSFSTIHPTSYHYHVSIPQFQISFPTTYSLMDEEKCSFIRPLLEFRACIENLAVEVENKLKCPAPNRSPDRSQCQPPKSTWFTPPRHDRFVSKMPTCEVLDSVETFDSDNDIEQSGGATTLDEEPDEFGFVKRGERWFNLNTQEYWDSSPFA